MTRSSLPAGRPHIHEGGVLSRDPAAYRSYRSSLSRFVEWKRVAWIAVPALVLVVTNPANGILPCLFSFASDDWIGRPGITNFGLFSLVESIEGVSVSGLLTKSAVCPFYDPKYDPIVGGFCASIADTLCHKKPFFVWEYLPVRNYFRDLTTRGLSLEDFVDAVSDSAAALAVDKVHVVHRLICTILVWSAIWNYCCPRMPPLRYVLLGSVSGVPPVSTVTELWTSTLCQSRATTSLFRDLVYQNLYVYPALVELDRIVPKLRRSSWMVRPTGNVTADYLLAVILLVLILGGGSNAIASRIVGNGRTLTGYSAVAGVGLGYLIRNSSAGVKRILATLGRQDISYVHAFWSNVAWTFVGHPEDWYPRVVVWLVAGLAGSIYAEFHLDHVDLYVFRDILGYLGF